MLGPHLDAVGEHDVYVHLVQHPFGILLAFGFDEALFALREHLRKGPGAEREGVGRGLPVLQRESVIEAVLLAFGHDADGVRVIVDGFDAGDFLGEREVDGRGRAAGGGE